MIKWEYKAIYGEYWAEFTTRLNNEGNDGWELVNYIYPIDDSKYSAVFKRQLNQNSNSGKPFSQYEIAER